MMNTLASIAVVVVMSAGPALAQDKLAESFSQAKETVVKEGRKIGSASPSLRKEKLDATIPMRGLWEKGTKFAIGITDVRMVCAHGSPNVCKALLLKSDGVASEVSAEGLHYQQGDAFSMSGSLTMTDVNFTVSLTTSRIGSIERLHAKGTMSGTLEGKPFNAEVEQNAWQTTLSGAFGSIGVDPKKHVAVLRDVDFGTQYDSD
ncbi:MAG: hypothetical protein WC728_00945, partial [Elusimicrobiota bacterium]